MVGAVNWGERVADKMSAFIGSWKFVIGQAALLAAWFLWNIAFVAIRFDPYPFILANLFMSAEAAFATPLIMMAQNRTDAADRRVLHEDLKADQEALDILKILKMRSDQLLSYDEIKNRKMPDA